MKREERVKLEHKMMTIWNGFWEDAIDIALDLDIKEKVNIRNEEVESELFDLYYKIYPNNVNEKIENNLMYIGIVDFQKKLDELHEKYMNVDANIRNLEGIIDEFFNGIDKVLHNNVSNMGAVQKPKLEISKEEIEKIMYPIEYVFEEQEEKKEKLKDLIFSVENDMKKDILPIEKLFLIETTRNKIMEEFFGDIKKIRDEQLEYINKRENIVHKMYKGHEKKYEKQLEDAIKYDEMMVKKTTQKMEAHISTYREHETEIDMIKEQEKRVLEYIEGMKHIVKQDGIDNTYKKIKKHQNLYTESILKSTKGDMEKLNEEQLKEISNMINKIKKTTMQSKSKKENEKVLYGLEDIVTQYFDTKINNLEIKNANVLEGLRDVINKPQSVELNKELSVELSKNNMDYLLNMKKSGDNTKFLIEDVELKRELLQAIKLNNTYRNKFNLKASPLIDKKNLKNKTDDEIIDFVKEKIKLTLNKSKQKSYQKKEVLEHKKVGIMKSLKKLLRIKRNILKKVGKEFTIATDIERENKDILIQLNRDIVRNNEKYKEVKKGNLDNVESTINRAREINKENKEYLSKKDELIEKKKNIDNKGVINVVRKRNIKPINKEGRNL